MTSSEVKEKHKTTKPTKVDLKERLRNWFLKELPNRVTGTTIEEAMNSPNHHALFLTLNQQKLRLQTQRVT